jgi:hypothetical protein
MTRFTVQCACAVYRTKTVTVEADTLAEALEKAIAAADQSPAWSSSDSSGPTFVEAVAEGHDVDLWTDDCIHPLPVPSGFTENGHGPHIVITVEGGIIQHVDFQDGTALVEVHDYDTEGTSEPGDVQRDPDGTPFLRGFWSNRIEDPVTGNPIPDDAD